MVRATPKPSERVAERWETMVEGTISVWVFDKRSDEYVRKQVGGKRHGKVLTISRDDRRYNEELIPEENAHLNPFRNGSLRLVSDTPDRTLDTSNHLTVEDLRAVVEDRAGFDKRIEAMDNELILRRLLAVVEEEGTVPQQKALKALLQQRYPIGGPTGLVREMLEEEARAIAGRRVPR